MRPPVPPHGVPVVLFPHAPGTAPGRSSADSGMRTPTEVEVGLRRLKARFTGAEPANLRAGVVPVQAGREMVAGSTAPLLQSRFVARGDGLLIPVSAVPVPIQLIGVYITAPEILGFAPSPELVEDHLERMTFTEVLGFVAGTLARHRQPDVSLAESDAEFSEQWLAGAARERVRNLLGDLKRRLVVPQALYVLVKLAARYCPDMLVPGVEPGRLPVALFGALGVLDEDGVGAVEEADRVVDTEVGAFSGRLLANQHLNKPLDEIHLMARFVRQWLELPGERSGESRVVDLQQAFADGTGVDLQDVLVVAAALWARTLSGEPYLAPAYFQELGWDDVRLAAALRLFTADPVTLRGILRDELRSSNLAWSVNTLGHYPVVRFDDGGLLVLDRNLLVRRIFGGLLAYDVVDTLAAGSRTGAKRARHVAGCLQHLAEVYALEVLQAVTTGGLGRSRVYDDAALQKAFARKGRRLADAAVDYGDAWVVVEVTTSKLTRDSVASSPTALSKDLDKLVGKVEQMDHTVAALRSEERKLTGTRAAPARRFYPLLVVADGFPVNPMSTELLRQRYASEGCSPTTMSLPWRSSTPSSWRCSKASPRRAGRASATCSRARNTRCSSGPACVTTCSSSAICIPVTPSGCRS